MGTARSFTVDQLITEKQFDLRDKLSASRFETGELLAYANRSYEILYMILANMNSDLVASGSGTITLADGTGEYSLSSNSMGDLWLPYKLNKQNRQGKDLFAIYLTDSSSGVHDALPMVSYEDHMDDLLSGTSGESQPQGFYLFGGNIGFSPVPDTTYTCTVLKYIPNFTPLSSASGTTVASSMPFYGIFNQDIGYGIELFAKQRNDVSSVAIEAQLMDYFRVQAIKIMGSRQHQPSSFSPRWR